MSCGVGHRHGSDPAWLWLWRRLVAAALTGPLAWEPSCATGAALEKTKKTKKKKKRKKDPGVPMVAQQVKSPTVSTRMQVQSLALLSGLRLQLCCTLQHSLQMWLGSGVALAVV